MNAATLGFAILCTGVKSVSTEDIVAMCRRAAASLGTYKARLTKEERVGGKLSSPHVIDATVRDTPLSLLLEFVGGPKAGRRILYNPEIDPKRMRAKEAGFLGLVPIWLELDSPLTRLDTNHPVTDLGFAALIDLLEREAQKARPFGGHVREDEGRDATGAWCMRFVAPPGATGLAAASVRACIDEQLELPTRIELFDEKGTLLERHVYDRIQPRVSVDPSLFTPRGARL